MKRPLFLFLLLITISKINAQNLKPFEANNGLYGYKDDKGKIIIPAQYITATYFFTGVDKAWVYNGTKFALIDKKNKLVIPFKYSYVNFFQEGLAVVATNTKFMEAGGNYGFVDKNGKEVIPLVYEAAEEFKDGKAKVKKAGKEFYIDKTGKAIQ
ncbi:WG repeat-containing protein [Ferruginibacter sp. SUN106]|uniref:WG repeat-containing protein n=1 Tax=Ferruginibacter sp. SUN106 TaxID=2978348 RepID=UPI003D36175F